MSENECKDTIELFKPYPDQIKLIVRILDLKKERIMKSLLIADEDKDVLELRIKYQAIDEMKKEILTYTKNQ